LTFFSFLSSAIKAIYFCFFYYVERVLRAYLLNSFLTHSFSYEIKDQNLSTSHSLKNKKKRKSNLDCYRTLSLSPNSTQQAEQLFLPAEKYDPLLDLSGKGYIVPDITFSFWEGRLGLIQLLLLPRRFNLSKDREFQVNMENQAQRRLNRSITTF